MNTNPYAVLITSLTLAGVASLGAAENDAITLVQSLPVGKTIKLTMDTSQKMGMGGVEALGGQGMNMTTKMSMDMTMDIQPHEAGRKKAVLVYDKAALAIDAGVFKQEFDSRDGDDNPFMQFVGKEIVVIYDEDDLVVDVQGADKLLSEEAKQGPMANMKEMFSGDTMKQMMRQGMLQAVPDKPIEPGDQWPFELVQQLPQDMGRMTIEGAYTYKKMDAYDGHPCAVIGVKGTLEGEITPGAKFEGQQIDLTFDNAEFEGTIYFDNALGMPRKGDTLTRLRMQIDVAGQKMTMDIAQTVIQKITAIEDATDKES